MFKFNFSDLGVEENEEGVDAGETRGTTGSDSRPALDEFGAQVQARELGIEELVSHRFFVIIHFDSLIDILR